MTSDKKVILKNDKIIRYFRSDTEDYYKVKENHEVPMFCCEIMFS